MSEDEKAMLRQLSAHDEGAEISLSTFGDREKEVLSALSRKYCVIMGETNIIITDVLHFEIKALDQ